MTTDKKSKYQPTKDELNGDVSVSVTPERLAQAVLKGGASRREIEESEECPR